MTHETVRVTLELPRDRFAAARAVLAAEVAFNDLRTALDAVGIVAAIEWGDVPATLLTPAPTAASSYGAWITPERDALLRELYPAGVAIKEIVARVNALPGLNGSAKAIMQRAVTRLNLRRSSDAPQLAHAADRFQ